jgi:hypothetical protein
MTAALPKAIQAQLDQAEQIHNEVYGGTPEAPNPAQAVSDIPANPAPNVAASVTIEPAAPDTQTAPVATPAPADDAFERRYNVLRGKYEAEVPRLQQQLKENQAVLNQLLEERKKANEAPPAPTKAESLVSPKDEENFGADLMEAVVRVATQIAKHEMATAELRLRGEFEAVKGQIGQVADRQVKTAEQLFWDRVSELVPDWMQVDEDARWHAFLDVTPEFSTLTYRQLAGAAIEAGDAGKVAKLVQAWKNTFQAATTAPAAPAQPTRTQELARQVAPDTSRASSTPTPQSKLWTRADYEAAYDTRNVSRFGAEKAVQMQAEADQAVAEGRVQW